MNSPEDKQIEELLRQAPSPRAREGAKRELIGRLESAAPRRTEMATGIAGARPEWLRRWWPAWVPAALLLVCVTVLGVQQAEIRELKQIIATLTTNTSSAQEAARAPTAVANKTVIEAESEAQEIARLNTLANVMRAEIAELERIGSENERLRAELAAPRITGLAPEETAALEEARERARRIACLNHMKQMGLAARIWEGRHGSFPENYLWMTNELNTPKLLVCPSDTRREAAANWSSVTGANLSYGYHGARGTATEPTRVLFMCPIHGHAGLCDGSVHRIGNEHSEYFVQRDGKLYFEPPNRKSGPATEPAP